MKSKGDSQKLDQGGNTQAVEGQRATDSTDESIVGAIVHIHDSVDDTCGSINEANVHGSLRQNKPAQNEERQNHRQLLNEVLVDALRIIEFNPLLIGQFIRVATVACVRPTTDRRLTVREELFVLLIELVHKLFSECPHPGGDHDDERDNETLDAENRAGKKHEGELFW